MTKKTDENLLLALLDTYTSGVTNSLETVASMNGVSFRSVYSWLRDPEIILDEYMGERNISFGKAMNLARNVSKVLTVGRSLEDRVLNGLKVQVWHHGQPSYQDDEKAILIEDLDLREIIFGYRDGKKRDSDGNRIIMTKIEAPPAQLVEVYARANMPSIYGHKTETTIKGDVQLGVTVVAGQRRPLPPEAIPYAKPEDLDVVETVLLDAPGEVYEPIDAGLDELLGLDGSSAAEDLAVTDTDPAEPVTAAPEPDEEVAAETGVLGRDGIPAQPAAPGAAGPGSIAPRDPGAYSSAPGDREAATPADPLLNVAPGWRREYQALLERNATNAANAAARRRQ